MFRIINKPITVQKRLKEAISKKLGEDGLPKRLDTLIESVRKELEVTVQQSLFQSPEFFSLIGGSLQLDFGISSDNFMFIPLIMTDLTKVSSNWEIESGKIVISFYIEARSEDDGFVSSAIQRARYVSPRSGELIDWLRWLLYEGTAKINETYRVKVLPGKGRSLMGIMIVDKKNIGFSVDPQFAGVAGSNFVSRSILAAWPNLKEKLTQYV